MNRFFITCALMLLSQWPAVADIAFPYEFGSYHKIKCRPGFPQDKRVSELYVAVYEIDGGTLKEPLMVMLECFRKYMLSADKEYVLSGYFTYKQYGSPDAPQEFIDSKYMFGSQFFVMRPVFCITRIIAPEDEKIRFQEEVLVPLFDTIRSIQPTWTAPEL